MGPHCLGLKIKCAAALWRVNFQWQQVSKMETTRSLTAVSSPLDFGFVQGGSGGGGVQSLGLLLLSCFSRVRLYATP